MACYVGILEWNHEKSVFFFHGGKGILTELGLIVNVGRKGRELGILGVVSSDEFGENL